MIWSVPPLFMKTNGTRPTTRSVELAVMSARIHPRSVWTWRFMGILGTVGQRFAVRSMNILKYAY